MIKEMHIKKEWGDIVIVHEIEELGRRFDADINVIEFDRPPVVAVLEWAIPAAFILFLTKPFFQEMMKELGKEAGKNIANAIKKQFAEAKNKSPRLYRASDIIKLEEAERNLSESEVKQLRATLGRQHAPLEIDVAVTLSSGVAGQFRFVFLPSLEDKDIDIALIHLANDGDNIIQKKIEELALHRLPNSSVDLFAVYVSEEKKWVDMRELILLLQKNKN